MNVLKTKKYKNIWDTSWSIGMRISNLHLEKNAEFCHSECQKDYFSCRFRRFRYFPDFPDETFSYLDWSKNLGSFSRSWRKTCKYMHHTTQTQNFKYDLLWPRDLWWSWHDTRPNPEIGIPNTLRAVPSTLFQSDTVALPSETLHDSQNYAIWPDVWRNQWPADYFFAIYSEVS